MKKKRGKPEINDTQSLLIAAFYQKRDHCSERSALLQAARLAASDEVGAQNMLRKFQDKLKGMTLKQFTENQPLELTQIEKNSFAFLPVASRLRD